MHRKYGSSEFVIKHCKTVAKLAWVLSEGLRRKGKEVDSEGMIAGAFLHDIGRNTTQTVRYGW